MKGGFSNCEGIMIYDTVKDKAIFGYYYDNIIQIEEGNIKDIKDKFSKYKETYERKDGLEDKIVISIAILYLCIVILSLFLFPFLLFLSILVFCLGSYFPFIVIIFANINTYINVEKNKQAKRYHACEHAIIHIIDQDDVTLEDLKKSSIYDAECGNVYCGYFLFLLIVICYLIINIFTIGLLKSFLIVLGTILLLFINLFNPFNPFLSMQKPTIEQPTDKDYLLALELVKEWQRNF